MAERDAKGNAYSLENSGNLDVPQEDNNVKKVVIEKIKRDEDELFDCDTYLHNHESPLRREDNPFSFKKFLNQDSSAQKGARKKVYAPGNVSSSKINLSNHSHSSRMVNTTDVSSVLPDFVQDHLVIEQCYLSGSSPTVDIDTLNFQNLPDLNIEHRNVHFNLNTDKNLNDGSQNCADQHSTNLPDFALGVRHFQSVNEQTKRLPDFTYNARTNLTSSLDANGDNNVNCKNKASRRKVEIVDGIDTSHSMRQKTQTLMPFSPSVPIGLPSYENDSKQDAPIPFDLTVPAEENSGRMSNRGMHPNETVSKSLPDFLSDGPIKKVYDENIQKPRGSISSDQNGLPPPEFSSVRAEKDRLAREVEILRRQLTEKNRRVEFLESELEHLHNKDQRETANLEYALQEFENNLQQTAKRAFNAEEIALNLKQENKLLKSEIYTLRSEIVELRLRKSSVQNITQEDLNHKIAQDLRKATTIAENSLKSLLNGLENLRMIATSLENTHKTRQENTDDYPAPYLHEDCAFGPAL